METVHEHKAIRVISQFYLPEDVYEGDVSYRDRNEELRRYDPWDGPAVEWAAELLRDEGCTQPSSSGRLGSHAWWSSPEGSFITDFGTGERCEPSCHPVGFSVDEVNEINDKLKERG